MNIITEEKIDKYLLGDMKPEERAQFESELKSNAELKNDYETQMEIVNGVQRVALREFLVECERKRSATRVENFKWKFDVFVSHRKKMAWCLYMAAALAVLVCVIGYSNISNTIQNAALEAIRSTQIAVARGGSEIDYLLASTYEYIVDDQIKLAEKTLLEANIKIQAVMDKPIVTDDDRADHEEALIQQYDYEWYHAIILMKQGKVIRSKIVLKDIASSASIHADEASQVLIDIY